MIAIEENRKLKEFSTFGIGGPARYFVTVKNNQELLQAFQFASSNHLQTLIVGKGSNCLFNDCGFDGLVILNRIDFLTSMEEGSFTVGAGYSFSLLGTQTARQGYSGLEFASGIPGTVGGAVFMNAGANGSETCNFLVSVEYMSCDGALHSFPIDELEFGYRTSLFQKMAGSIVSSTFKLHPCKHARKRQIEIIQKRKNSQPLKEMSAGCIFRNPKGVQSGKLIEECGLKGLQIGGAKVSDIHANFITNTGTATSEDVIRLMEHIKKKIKEEFDQDLVSEIRMIPELKDVG